MLPASAGALIPQMAQPLRQAFSSPVQSIRQLPWATPRLPGCFGQTWQFLLVVLAGWINRQQ
jgi:hypothetical protein